MTQIVNKFADRLKEIRESKGISQEELSRDCGFDRTYVGKIERAEKSPSLETISKLADQLDVDVADFFR